MSLRTCGTGQSPSERIVRNARSESVPTNCMSDPPQSGPGAAQSGEVLATNEREATIDETLRVLADHERRYICYYLYREGALNVDDLARLVAATKTDGQPDADDLTATGVSLRHVHLPALADADIVSYDREGETACLAEDAPFVRELLAVTGVELQ